MNGWILQTRWDDLDVPWSLEHARSELFRPENLSPDKDGPEDRERGHWSYARELGSAFPAPQDSAAQVAFRIAGALVAHTPERLLKDVRRVDVNALRTRTKVTTEAHRDDCQAVAIVCCRLVNTMAPRTVLYAGGIGIFSTRLMPGDVLMFEDGAYEHETRPLSADDAERDAIVVGIGKPLDHAVSWADTEP